MRTHLFIGCLAILMTACNTSKKADNDSQQDSIRVETATVAEQPVTTITVTPLKGYFLKNTYKFTADTDCILFPNQAGFDNALGVGKTMDNQISKPDFAGQTVGAIAMKPVQNQTEITISKAEVAGNAINLYYDVKKGDAITYTITPVLVFQFPHTTGVDTVHFITNGQTVSTLSIAQ